MDTSVLEAYGVKLSERTEVEVVAHFSGQLATSAELMPEFETRHLEFSSRLPEAIRIDINKSVIESGVTIELAPLALENALLFLDALAKNPGLVLSPSDIVDTAWHRLILNTEGYENYCSEYAGRFLHHRPTGEGRISAKTPVQTFEILTLLGYEVDESVWGNKADCDSGCDGGGGGGGRCDGGCDGV